MGTRGGLGSGSSLNDGPVRPPSLAALGRSSSHSSTGSNSSIASASSALAARFQQQDAEQVRASDGLVWGGGERDGWIDRRRPRIASLHAPEALPCVSNHFTAPIKSG